MLISQYRFWFMLLLTLHWVISACWWRLYGHEDTSLWACAKEATNLLLNPLLTTRLACCLTNLLLFTENATCLILWVKLTNILLTKSDSYEGMNKTRLLIMIITILSGEAFTRFFMSVYWYRRGGLLKQ